MIGTETAIDLQNIFFRANFDPLSVREVVAAWMNRSTYAGVVVRLASGRFAYAWIRDITDLFETTTQFFDTEPTYLYDRSHPWFSRGQLDAVNQTLGYAKTAAKYGSLGRDYDQSQSGPILRSAF